MVSTKTILVVDDEEETLNWLERKLTNENYTVVRAGLAQDALEKIRKNVPHLVLMDIVLPDMEGSEVVRILAQDALTSKIPIIFMSGIISREDQTMDLEVKVAGRLYKALSKPFDASDLLREVRKTLEI